MHNSYYHSDTDDDELPVPKNIFMTDKTVQNFHSRGWFETDDQAVDANDSRVLQINDTVFKMDDMLDKSDTQYEAFLLEVERANDEFFKTKCSGSSVNTYRQPVGSNRPSRHGSNSHVSGNSLGTSAINLGISSNSLGMSAAVANVEFNYGAYENGDYYDVDNVDDQDANNDYYLGNGDEKDDEDGVELEEEDDGEESDEQDGVEEPDDQDDVDESDDKEDDDGMDTSIELPLVKVQKVSTGYIINSNVYLTIAQWHTLLTDTDINQTYCVLCDEYIDLDKDAEHIEEADHLDSFNLFKPLKRFELSITRLIRTKYHCGVCNALFDDQEDNNHVDTKQHGDNMLFAINKASDLVYDYNLDKSREDMPGQRQDTPDKRQDTMTYPLNTPTSTMSYSACFSKPARASSVDSYREDTPDPQDYEQDTYDQADDTQMPGVSYAAMAKKTKLDELPDLLKIDLGDKLVTVKFDSWHMIISTGLNQLYCMACLVSEHKRSKADHCRSSSHLEKLMRCSVVEVYETHLIRKVDEKLYHCGHCNNLQPIDLMEEHVEQYHPRNTRAPAIPKSTEIHQLLASNPARNLENQLVSPTHARSQENQQLIGANQARYLENQHLDRPGPSHAWNPQNNQLAGTNQARNHPVTSRIHEDATTKVTKDFHDTNFQKPTTSETSQKMESTDTPTNSVNTAIQNSTTNLAVEQHKDTPRTSPAKDPIDYFQSIWQERSPVKPKAELPSTADAKEINVPAPTPSKNSTDNSKTSEITTSCTVEPKSSPSPVPSPQRVKPANKNVPVLNFQPDFVKTIHQFGYKLSVHILSLNAIIKMQYFYRCVFCDINVEEAMLLEHMLDYRHVALIPTAPYMPEFSLHLIRRIRMLVHCAICNLVLPNDHLVVLTHNASPTHSFLLKRSLGFEAHSAANPVLPDNQAAPLIPPAIPLPPLIPLPPSHGNSPVLNSSFMVPPPPVPNLALNVPNGVAPPNLALNVPNCAAPPNLALNVPNGVAPPISPNNTPKPETPEPKSAKKSSKPNVVTEEVLVSYTEEYYLVKQRKQLVKVHRDALNTIVYCGDGTLYCFVCETNIGTGDSMEHISDKGHRKCLTESKMVNNYGNSLLRQLENMFHCATCNVVIQKKYLQRHLDWYKHLKSTEEAFCNSENDKLDDNHDEIPKIDIPTQKERLNVKEKGKFVIHFSFVIDRNHGKKDSNDNVLNDDDVPEPVPVKRMNKIIIVKDEVFKIKWEHWHGLVTYKDGYKCKICNSDFDEEEWRSHVQEPRHVAGLGKPLIEELGRDLLRQLSDSKLHCLICNAELSTSDNICEHLDGKKHNKNRDLIIEESSKVNAYNDCEKDVLFL